MTIADAMPLQIAPGTACDLSSIATHPGQVSFDKRGANQRIRKNARIMADLARRLYAEDRHAILLVLQGMDTSGKDGTIRTIMRGINPQSCQVVSFKVPSAEELDHDFLWRIHHRVPRLGNIGIFNRSHYEDVLVVRVHGLVAEEVWSRRYDQINAFERILTENRTVILKCFLHISRDEQRKRLQARIDQVEDHWKFNPQDLKERRRWDEYQAAYEAALTRCNTEHAPWHIVPADKKWYRNLLVSNLLRQTLERLDPQFPPANVDFQSLVVE